MKNKFYLLINLLVVFVFFCSDVPTKPDPKIKLSLIEKLKLIPDIQITEISPETGFIQSLELVLTQPVDHNNPSGQQFYQRMYLHHVDEETPFVFCPSGYTSNPKRIYDLTSALNANQLQITHRYVGDAKPNPTDWQNLTIEQASADHHRIVEFFKNIYTGKWLRTIMSVLTIFAHLVLYIFYLQYGGSSISSGNPIPNYVNSKAALLVIDIREGIEVSCCA